MPASRTAIPVEPVATQGEAPIREAESIPVAAVANPAGTATTMALLARSETLRRSDPDDRDDPGDPGDRDGAGGPGGSRRVQAIRAIRAIQAIT